jgi:hypothetical protein
MHENEVKNHYKTITALGSLLAIRSGDDSQPPLRGIFWLTEDATTDALNGFSGQAVRSSSLV